MQLNKAKIRYVNEDVSKSPEVKSSRMSIYSENYKGEFYYIELFKLIPFKNQAREIFDEEGLRNLAESIKAHGVRQPLTIIPSESQEGFFEIISGERRFRAARMAGLEKVPCIIIHDRNKAEEIAIIENIQREDLHPIELKNAYKNLIALQVCKSYQDIAEKVCTSKSSVGEIMDLDRLPDAIQKHLLNNRIKSRKLFRQLLKTPEAEQLDIINSYTSNNKALIVPKIRKGPSLVSKRKVLTVSVFGDQILIENNKISKLSQEQKIQLKNIINELEI